MRVIRDLMLPIVFGMAARDGGKSMIWLQGHHVDFTELIKPHSINYPESLMSAGATANVKPPHHPTLGN